MDHLSPEDARLLYADTPHANGNVSLIHIYDQRTAPGGTVRFKTILQQIESRLSRSPVFRRKLVRVPLELDLPYWVDDAHFDLEYHVRHIALPKPGDWRQFCIQVSRIHARALDLDRPPWEIYVIEGLDSFIDLPPGSFALVTKTHHAVVSADHGAAFTELLHDLSAEAGQPAPPQPWLPAPGPSAREVLTRGLVRTVTSPLRLAAPVTRALVQAAPAALAKAGERWLGHARLQAIRFNSAVSSHRVFETRRFPIDDFKRIRGLVDGASVNDVVLAVCGGALRRYLMLHGELPAEGLTAIAPVYVRGADDEADAAPTQLTWLQAPLHTELADPRERLAAIVAHTAASGTVKQAVSVPDIIAHHAPAATLALASQLFGRTLASRGRHTPLAHCTITHVPGSDHALFLCGARLVYFSAMLPLHDGMGLVFAVTTVDGRIVISPTSCRELMPDPEVFATQLRESYEELRAAAEAARVAAPERAPRRASRRR
ncbi:MAG: wax ester/triacylglycerol synthase family O-acyltransferase [Rubrivivax sp.]|nr:wax ester/triacylglycerol synthase family O-acyltransferase [Rubrivivax sp.]